MPTRVTNTFYNESQVERVLYFEISDSTNLFQNVRASCPRLLYSAQPQKRRVDHCQIVGQSVDMIRAFVTISLAVRAGVRFIR